MPLSWNEIKSRAITFSKEWENETSEDAEAKSFWDDFFNVFGISRRRVATFEQQVRKIDDKAGFIDLLWKGMILIEHKSRGKDLDKAFSQAKDYFPGLKEKELPRYILVSDFARFRLYDLDENTHSEFGITDFVDHVQEFGFIAGYQKRSYKEQDPVNIEAAELMGQLHDKLKEIGYAGHHLELYLVRLLFCLFADDTNIFERGIFQDYLELKTNEDGSDLAGHISHIFETLNCPPEKRLKNLDESLTSFPYVNGKLFEEHLPIASFDSSMRKTLLDCCLLDWGKISPAIFGSLFQSVMDPKARRNLGAHYTSEKNILKLIKPLFLDDLWEEFESVKTSKAKLQRFHDKISQLQFLDPACGCGNFLIIAYREIRLLEIEIIKTLLFRFEKIRTEVAASAGIDVGHLVKCDVDKFYGIEYEEFPAQIAQVAMWLIDHQMNQLVSNTFGEYYVRLPLRKSATIVQGNALQLNWDEVNEKRNERFNYIFGNPPFIGHQWRNAQQGEDMNKVFAGVPRAGRLDYVAGWYVKAAQYMSSLNLNESNSNIVTGFVSTSSITQGEQVSILWKYLSVHYKIKIHFAHRTFKWRNESKENAGVHVVIIGFSNFDISKKKLYEYDDLEGEAHETIVRNINPYLTKGNDVFLENRGKPIHGFPEMFKGSQPTDGGFLVLTKSERDEILSTNTKAADWIKPYWGADEFLYNRERYCLWLKEISPPEIRSVSMVMARVEKVRNQRLKSPTKSVRQYANLPTLFTQDRQPHSQYLAVPEVSSENRTYIPIGFLQPDIICSNKLQIIPNATLYMFGVLQSLMHNVWTKEVCGRLESRISYSPSIYNNFPWPQSLSSLQTSNIENAAQTLLNIRDKHSRTPLADLYDPHFMPQELLAAHLRLDKYVDIAYRSQPFLNDSKRIEFLFDLYEKYTAGLFKELKSVKSKRIPKKSN